MDSDEFQKRVREAENADLDDDAPQESPSITAPKDYDELNTRHEIKDIEKLGGPDDVRDPRTLDEDVRLNKGVSSPTAVSELDVPELSGRDENAALHPEIDTDTQRSV